MSSFLGKLSNFHNSLRMELQRQKEGWKEVCNLMQKFNLVNDQSITLVLPAMVKQDFFLI